MASPKPTASPAPTFSRKPKRFNPFGPYLQGPPFDFDTLNENTMGGDILSGRTPRGRTPRVVPKPPQPGWLDPLLLMIPDKLLPSRDGWYGRLYG